MYTACFDKFKMAVCVGASPKFKMVKFKMAVITYKMVTVCVLLLRYTIQDGARLRYEW